MSEARERRATRSLPPDSPCLNCGDATPGNFCPRCGQRKAEVLVSVRSLLADVLEDQLVLNRALPRTLGALLFHPGVLTAEYVRGRIVRYIAPFRLYLVSSVVFFLILSFVGIDRMNTTLNVREPAAAAGGDSIAAVIDSLTTGFRTGSTPEAAGLPDSTREAIAGALERATGAADGDSLGTSAFGALASDTAFQPGTLQPYAERLQTVNLPPPFGAALQRKVMQVGHLPPGEALREVLRDLLEYAPHMVFILLPIFALLLKLLYVRRSRFYAEHFVFALHMHAFVFVMFTIMFLLPWEQLDLLLLLWIIAYLWLALKRVYGQGWIRTTLKWWTLGWMYAWALLFGLIGLAIVTLLFT
jgi:hypothetical protein